MTLSLSLVRTERVLARHAQNARQHWTTRSACLVTLEGDNGVRGVGEASPLPGFSLDTLEQCQAALLAVDARLLPPQLESGQSVFEALARTSAQLPARVPAARAALEGALLDLWSRAVRKPAWSLLLDGATTTPSRRAIAALLTGDAEQTLDQARRAEQRGIRTFKLKIGSAGALDQELAAASRLRSELGPDVRLRLDANQSLNLAEARAGLSRFAALRLEYIEEPCQPSELPRLTELELPLALDESLTERAAADNVADMSALGIQALILKPTLLGGVSGCYAWAQAARQLGARVILSHAFEGPIGLSLSAGLALALGSADAAHGLDLEGARLEHCDLRPFSGAHVEPWSEPGFGDWQSAR